MSIALLMQYKQESGLSQNKIAKELGVSSTVVSQYLAGKYEGDVKAIDTAVEQLINRQSVRQKELKLGFTKTKTALKIMGMCKMAQATHGQYLVIGGAGLGKTCALKAYANENKRSVVLIETDPTFTAKVLLMELCDILGVVSNKQNMHAMMTDIIDRLADSDTLIIVDEAELLSYKPLEIIRRIHDKAGVGLVLAGMPKLKRNLKGAGGEFTQLYSRFDRQLDLNDELPQEDIDAMCADVLDTDQFNAYLYKACHGNARRLNKIIKGVNHLMQKRGEPMNKSMIDSVVRNLIN